MDWIQVLTIIGVMGAFNFYMFNKLDVDIKDQGTRMDAQVARIDQLYHMFVDLLKQGK